MTTQATFKVDKREESASGFVLKLSPPADCPFTRLWLSGPKQALELSLADQAAMKAIPLGAIITVTITTP